MMSDPASEHESSVPSHRGAASEDIPAVYERLRAAARQWFHRQPQGATLQPTALVHEAFVKIAMSDGATWESRAHFLALASRAMRQILIDAARSRASQRRGGDWTRITLNDAERGVERTIDLIALNEALEELGELSERQARIVEMHFLGGMTFQEIAGVLEIPIREARREWYMARAFLRRRLDVERES